MRWHSSLVISQARTASSAELAGISKPINSIDAPPAGGPDENIDASFKLLNWRRPKLLVPVGGVLVRLPFRLKVALCPSDN